MSTVGALGVSGSAQSRDPALRTTQLREREIRQRAKQMRRAGEYDEIVQEFRRDLEEPLDTADYTGFRTTHPERDEWFEIVSQRFETSPQVRAQIILVTTDNSRELFGNIRAPATRVGNVRSLVQRSGASELEIPPGQLVVDKYVGDELNGALLIDNSEVESEDPDRVLEDGDLVGTANVSTDSVTTTSSSFEDCVVEESGINDWTVFGCGGACISCLGTPEVATCLPCGACATKAGCYIGLCADEHEHFLCYSAISGCAALLPGPCPVAWGCVVGDCSVID